MFREMFKKQKAISREECIKILTEQKRGVLCVLGDEGYPYGTPMNHWYSAADGCIYFHCGRGHSHRLDSLANCDKVSFCVYDEGYRDEGDWALNIKSVIVFGRVEVIDDIAAVTEISAELSRKFTRDEAYISAEIEAYAKATLLLRLVPEHISGKAIKES